MAIITRTISGSLTHMITGSLNATALTGSLQGTASYSSKTNFLESNGYIADTTYGTQVLYTTGSISGTATSSLGLIKSVRTDTIGNAVVCYNVRTEIVGTYGDDTGGTAKVIGGTLNATVKHNLAVASFTIIGSITQVKNTDFTGTIPEFTYGFDIVGTSTQLNLKATGANDGGSYPIKWAAVSYFTTGIESRVVGY